MRRVVLVGTLLPGLTDSMAALTADGCQALDVCPRQRGGQARFGQLRQQVLRQLGEGVGAAAGHQVAERQDGALPHRHPGAGELTEPMDQ